MSDKLKPPISAIIRAAAEKAEKQPKPAPKPPSAPVRERELKH